MNDKKIYLKNKPSEALQEVLINERYDIEYIEEETEAQVSRMGRKRMINVPAKDGRFRAGNGVRLLKMDGTGPRGRQGMCRKKRNI